MSDISFALTRCVNVKEDALTVFIRSFLTRVASLRYACHETQHATSSDTTKCMSTNDYHILWLTNKFTFVLVKRICRDSRCQNDFLLLLVFFFFSLRIRTEAQVSQLLLHINSSNSIQLGRHYSQLSYFDEISDHSMLSLLTAVVFTNSHLNANKNNY